MAIENVTDDTGVLSIVGPNARQLLGDVIGDEAKVRDWKFLDAKQVCAESSGTRLDYF